MSMETQILAVAQQFTREVMKLEALKEGAGATIQLSLKGPSRYDTDRTPKLELICQFYDGKNHSTVTAGSLGALMDEVHRRCGFADKQAFVMEVNERSLVALEAPKGWDSVES
jgi:hypothetical protein